MFQRSPAALSALFAALLCTAAGTASARSYVTPHNASWTHATLLTLSADGPAEAASYANPARLAELTGLSLHTELDVESSLDWDRATVADRWTEAPMPLLPSRASLALGTPWGTVALRYEELFHSRMRSDNVFERIALQNGIGYATEERTTWRRVSLAWGSRLAGIAFGADAGYMNVHHRRTDDASNRIDRYMLDGRQGEVRFGAAGDLGPVRLAAWGNVPFDRSIEGTFRQTGFLGDQPFVNDYPIGSREGMPPRAGLDGAVELRRDLALAGGVRYTGWGSVNSGWSDLLDAAAALRWRALPGTRMSLGGYTVSGAAAPGGTAASDWDQFYLSAALELEAGPGTLSVTVADSRLTSQRRTGTVWSASWTWRVAEGGLR